MGRDFLIIRTTAPLLVATVLLMGFLPPLWTAAVAIFPQATVTPDDIDADGNDNLSVNVLWTVASETVSSGNHIAVRESGFDPAVTIVIPGEEVTWTNLDVAGHTVTAGTPNSNPSGEKVFLPVLLKYEPTLRQQTYQDMSTLGSTPLFDSGPLIEEQCFSCTFTQTGVYDYFSELSPVVATGTVYVIDSEAIITGAIRAENGGTISAPTGLSVTFESGSLLTDTTVSLISARSTLSNTSVVPSGHLHSVELKWPGVLSGTATISLPYDEADFPSDAAEADLNGFYFNGLDWIAAPSTVDTANNKVEIATRRSSWWKVGLFCAPFEGAYDGQAQIAYDRSRDLMKALADHKDFFAAFLVDGEGLFDFHSDRVKWLAGQRMCDLDDLTPATIQANLGVSLTARQVADVMVALGQDLMAPESDAQHLARLHSVLSDSLGVIDLSANGADLAGVSNLAGNFLLNAVIEIDPGVDFDIAYDLEVQGSFGDFQDWVNMATPVGLSNLQVKTGSEVLGDDHGGAVTPCQHLFDSDSRFYYTREIYGSHTYANLYEQAGELDFVLGLQEMDELEVPHWAPPLFRDRLNALILVMYEEPGENQVGVHKKVVRMRLQNTEMSDTCSFSRVQLPDARRGTPIDVTYYLLDESGHVPLSTPPLSWAETTSFCYGFCTPPNASAPNTPSAPLPVDGAVDQPLDVNLSWVGGDPDEDAVTYDVYVAANDSTPDALAGSGLESANFDPGPLAGDTVYYWRVVSRDTYGAETTGPTWHFTTGANPNRPPNIPSNPSPASGALGQPLDVDLSWAGGDPNGDAVTYEVYFSLGDNTPDVFTSTATTVDPGQLEAGAHYHWQVVAQDEQGASTSGPVWEFSTLLTGVWREMGSGSASEGGISNNDGDSLLPHMAVSTGNSPYVVWLDDDSGAWQVYGRHWNGTAWQEIGAGTASDGGISDSTNVFVPASSYYSVAVTVSSNGTVYVAWADDSSGNAEIFVKQWDGSTWSEVGAGSATDGGISSNDCDSSEPALAVAPDGYVYAAWYDSSDSGGDNEIYVKRWNGSVWSEVGEGSASGGGISDNAGGSWHPEMAVTPAGTPFVTWADNSSGNWEIYVRKWDGNAWVEVGSHSATAQGISDTSYTSTTPSIAIDSQGMPYVAWNDHQHATYVRRWNGSIWEEVGTGSASDKGLCDSYYPSLVSTDPAVAIDAENYLYVAWSQYTGTHTNVYIKRWNGIAWEEIGTGSASDYGISGTPSSHSSHPQLMIGNNNEPVLVWQEGRDGDQEVYVLRWSR